MKKRAPRRPPHWVEERMADRPKWKVDLKDKTFKGLTHAERTRLYDELKAHHDLSFKEFVFGDLNLRFVQDGAKHGGKLTASLYGPRPTDRRRKEWHEKVGDPVALAASAVPMIFDIFEDYWGRRYGGDRVYELAAEYVGDGVTPQQVFIRHNQKKSQRPEVK